MGINIFIYILLFISIGGYFLDFEKYLKGENTKKLPQVIFKEPLMFTLDEKNLNRIIEAKEALRYKDKDIMNNTTIVLQNTKNTKKFDIENLVANKIIKKGDLLFLSGDVSYKRDNFIEFNTQELYYEIKTKKAYNKYAFNGRYKGHLIEGENINFDLINKNFNSKNIHFELNNK